MDFFTKMEQKFGRYAIRNLMLYLMILYIGGLILNYVSPGYYETKLALDMSKVFAGEIWRLFTYLLYPPSTNILYCILICYIYYSLGNALEKLWGSFYLNLYVFIGLFANILAAVLIYLIWPGTVWLLTPDSLYLSFLLAFAITVPDMSFYIFFIIPIRAKVLGIIYGVVLAIELVISDWPSRIVILASVLNFILFFTVIRQPVKRVKQVIRLKKYQQKSRPAAGKPRHVCAVCGRTELDSPELEFRYCSKCAGGREYCSEHLYTHAHVTSETGPEEEKGSSGS